MELRWCYVETYAYILPKAYISRCKPKELHSARKVATEFDTRIEDWFVPINFTFKGFLKCHLKKKKFNSIEIIISTLTKHANLIRAM